MAVAGFSTKTPWEDLPAKVREVILHGSGKTAITMTYEDGLRSYKTSKPFEGVVPNMERRWRETDSDWVRDDLAKYQSNKACEACNGHRLKPEALAVKLDGLHISQVAEFSVAQAAAWFGALNGKLRKKEQEIAARILKEINERLGFLVNVGLDYLTLSRGSGTLSGGVRASAAGGHCPAGAGRSRARPAHRARRSDRSRSERRGGYAGFPRR